MNVAQSQKINTACIKPTTSYIPPLLCGIDHPFVHWNHEVMTPNIQREPNDQQLFLDIVKKIENQKSIERISRPGVSWCHDIHYMFNRTKLKTLENHFYNTLISCRFLLPIF